MEGFGQEHRQRLKLSRQFRTTAWHRPMSPAGINSGDLPEWTIYGKRGFLNSWGLRSVVTERNCLSSHL